MVIRNNEAANAGTHIKAAVLDLSLNEQVRVHKVMAVADDPQAWIMTRILVRAALVIQLTNG